MKIYLYFYTNYYIKPISMPRQYPKKDCVNSDCKMSFTPQRRNQLFCISQCRINHNNDKRREKNLTVYRLEKELKRNEKILMKLMASPTYKDDQIAEIFIVHEGFNFDVSSDTKLNSKTRQLIRWSHAYGIEIKDPAHKTFTIHKRNRI